MPRPKQPNQLRLAERMRKLRIASGISGAKFARQLDWQQSRVSKIETGKQIATRDDVRAWATALGLDEVTRDELLDLAQLAASEYESWLETYHARGGGAKAQQAIGSIDEVTLVTRHFAAGMIPGLLQTRAYAQDVVRCAGGPGAWGTAPEELERIVTARMHRQKVLRDSGREFHYLLAEAALWNRFGSAATLAEQLEQLVALMEELPALDLRVIPRAGVYPAFPLATFRIRDEAMVSLEQQVGEHVVVDPKQVEAYIKQFDLLAGAALSRSKSITLIREIAADLR